MDIRFEASDEAFHQEVRAFLAGALPGELRYKVENGIELGREDVIGWHRILYVAHPVPWTQVCLTRRA